MSSDLLDLQLFRLINDWAGRFSWLDLTGIFLAKYAAFILCGVLILIFLFGKQAYAKRMVIVATVSGLLARFGVVTLIRLFYQRLRPIPVDAVHRLVVNTDWAFPSGHTSFFFALSAAVTFYNKKLGFWFFVASFLMGVARIFIGVHWPTDILGGILVGVVCAEIVQFIGKKLFPIKKQETPVGAPQA